MNVLTIIGQFFEFFIRLIPHIQIIKATCSGVKWVRGKKVVGMGPGLHWYWPITTELEVVVTARQTLNLPTQVLTTSDKRSVVVGGLIVYRIGDIVLAIGEKNFDVDDTARDVCMAALMEVISGMTFDELLSSPTTASSKLKRQARSKLRKFGVGVVNAFLTDLSECRTYRLIGDGNSGKPVP